MNFLFSPGFAIMTAHYCGLMWTLTVWCSLGFAAGPQEQTLPVPASCGWSASSCWISHCKREGNGSVGELLVLIIIRTFWALFAELMMIHTYLMKGLMTVINALTYQAGWTTKSPFKSFLNLQRVYHKRKYI